MSAKKIILFMALLMTTAGPLAQAGAPKLDGVRRDIFTLTTGFADGTFVQGLRGSKRFIVSEKKDAFAEMSEEKRAVDQAAEIPIDVAWMLGYTYLHQTGSAWTSATGISDDSHIFDAGLGADVMRRFSLDIGFALQKLAAENLSQGLMKIDFEFVIPLRGKREGEVGVEVDARDADGVVDARVEYQKTRIRESEARVEVPADVTFPQLRFGARLHFGRFKQSPFTSARSAAAALTDELTLEQALAGPEFTFATSPAFSVRFLALFGKFSEGLDIFTTYQSLGTSRSPGGLGLLTEANLYENLLLFPRRIMHLSAEFKVTDAWLIKVFATELAPKPTGREAAYALGGFLQGAFGPNWRAGLGLDLTLQKADEVSHSWVSVLGQLGYQF